MVGRYDVAIVGGGVAGAALGGLLAAAGLGVTVIEKERSFRDRVRGEGIHPWGVAEAKRLGLLPVLAAAGANELPIWQSYEDRIPTESYRWAEHSVDGLPEVAVSHPRLQEELLNWSRSRGVEVLRPAKAVSMQPNAELTVVQSETARTVSARLIVGADGRQSAVSRWIGATSRRDPTHHRIGGGLIDDVNLAADTTHATNFPGGRMFLMPQGRGRARVYYVSSTERLATSRADRGPADFIRACAALLPEQAFVEATPAGPVAFFPNADVWSSRIAAGAAVLIGDAAGANDPSVGQGLSILFRDVRELRELLLDGKDWPGALAAYAERRRGYYEVLRAHARWLAMLTTEEGPRAEARRERVAAARELDPSGGGFALIFARGPDGLVADETARRRFFGEDAG